MKITMTTSRFDFEDGSLMHSGETHEVRDALAERLIETGQAVRAEAPASGPRQARRERAVTTPKETR